MSAQALERCAYCERDVPVTWVEIGSPESESPLSARVAVCEACRGDGR